MKISKVSENHKDMKKHAKQQALTWTKVPFPNNNLPRDYHKNMSEDGHTLGGRSC